VQAAALVFGAAYVILNIIADVAAIALNPRLRHPR
jgi:peptide/nickel transport system permease protein